MDNFQGLTKTRLEDVEADSLVSGLVVGNNLNMIRYDGSSIDAGVVVGNTGNPGSPGVDGWVAAEIGAGVDLNQRTGAGSYTQSDDAEAAGGTNYPVPYAGHLEVYRNAGPTQIYQTYRVISGPLAGCTFTRSSRNGNVTWTAWTMYSYPQGVWLPVTYGDANLAAFDAGGSGYATPAYMIEKKTVTLRGTVLNEIARTAAFTIIDLSAYAPSESEIFTAAVEQTWTSSTVSAANSGSTTPSGGSAHTHTIAHTHSTPWVATRVDVTSGGLVRMTPTATNPLPIGAEINLSGISWDID